MRGKAVIVPGSNVSRTSSSRWQSPVLRAFLPQFLQFSRWLDESHHSTSLYSFYEPVQLGLPTLAGRHIWLCAIFPSSIPRKPIFQRPATSSSNPIPCLYLCSYCRFTFALAPRSCFPSFRLFIVSGSFQRTPFDLSQHQPHLPSNLTAFQLLKAEVGDHPYSYIAFPFSSVPKHLLYASQHR